MTVARFHHWLSFVAAASIAVIAGLARADDMARDLPPPMQLRDLDYGDVLFHFFQEDYFEAIVRLEASRDFGRIPHHEAEAELLSGGLYLSLGLYDEAENIFNRLLAGPVPQSVSNRAYFYLARSRYQRGFVDDAWRNLERIRGPLPGNFEPERRLLASNVLMAQGRYGEAVVQLTGWTDQEGWSDYARFNLGVALIRSGQTELGRDFLGEVGGMPGATEEQLALRDRANLALGFASLQQHDAEGAVAALNRVRLDGPFTNRALLGLGWAESDARRPERALVPWLALRDSKVLDSAVQESFLAVPYAYTQLAANGQAAQQYQLAVQAYAAEGKRIDESIAAIRQGGFLDSILEAVPRTNDVGWFWQLQKVPDAPHTRYLYQLLASHEFQEGLKNYRDLRIMQRNLDRWRDSLEAFDDMISAREQAMIDHESRKQALLARTDIPAFEQRQAELAARASAIESGRDVAALATGDEARQWQDRMRSVRTGLRETADALAEARLRLGLLQGGGGTAPRDAAGFGQRVAGLAARIDEITPRIDATAAAQERVLASIAVNELEVQKRRLANYATQAQFALASLYDRAAAGGTP
jgi:tetratricopeptide (TPR) repeat protein